jgi:hypothetical protein
MALKGYKCQGGQPIMIWLLTTTEVWTADRPDIGYKIQICEGEYPKEIRNVEELLRREAGLHLCSCFQTANDAERFVSDHGLRLLGPIPSH